MNITLEVVELVLHFLISLLVLAGGGLMLYSGHGDSQFVTFAMTAVIVFWFQNMTSKNVSSNLAKLFPSDNNTTNVVDTQLSPTTSANPTQQIVVNPATTTTTPKTGNNI